MTVTDALGCEASACQYVDSTNAGGCFVDISHEFNGMQNWLHAFAFGIAPYNYIWSTGDTTAGIPVSGPGTFCVTISDATGCTATACAEVLNYDSCYVWLACDPPGTLTAISTGFGPFIYEWSTGDSVQTIGVNPGETYCVTVTDATGCISTACQYIDSIPFIDTFCQVFVDIVSIDYDSGVAVLVASGSAIFGNFEYTWSNGSQGPTLVVDSSGTYCVTAFSNNTNCVATACITISFGPSGGANSIWGMVMAFPGNVVEGEVRLIEEDVFGMFQIVDSFTIDFDFGAPDSLGCPCYVFDNLTPGITYYTQFIPQDPDILPTYHFSSTVWPEAQPIEVPNWGQPFDILVQPTSPIMGPGFFGGFITSGVNFSSGDSRDNDPLPQVLVMLKDMSGMYVDYDWTDTAGEFEFPNLAWGRYIIELDFLNAETKEIEIEITPQIPVITDFWIEYTGDEFITEVHQISQWLEFEIFPNPVNDELTIRFNNLLHDTQVELRSLQGALIESRHLKSGSIQTEWYMGDLPAGMYLLSFNQNGNIFFEKLMKTE